MRRALAMSCGGFFFQLAPTLSLPRAKQLVLAPQHPGALGIALDTHNTIWRRDDELVPEHRLMRLARHSLPLFGKYQSHLT